jgi:hypothetical protein
MQGESDRYGLYPSNELEGISPAFVLNEVVISKIVFPLPFIFSRRPSPAHDKLDRFIDEQQGKGDPETEQPLIAA